MRLLATIIVCLLLVALSACQKEVNLSSLDPSCANLWDTADGYCSQISQESCLNSSYHYAFDTAPGNYPVKCIWDEEKLACHATAICQ